MVPISISIFMFWGFILFKMNIDISHSEIGIASLYSNPAELADAFKKMGEEDDDKIAFVKLIVELYFGILFWH